MMARILTGIEDGNSRLVGLYDKFLMAMALTTAIPILPPVHGTAATCAWRALNSRNSILKRLTVRSSWSMTFWR